VGEFRRLFDDNYDYVWSSLRRLGIHERDLEDVTHEVFLEVYRKRAARDPARPVRPWLFAFAVRFASDYRKSARHRTELRADVDPPSSAPSQEDSLSNKDTAKLLAAALDALSLELRAVIVLYEIDGVPMKDITDALGIPLFTGYSRLRLAREQCAERIRRMTKGGTR
jgi:RNA polymerase sigma-70 factor (ECF subfamily)